MEPIPRHHGLDDEDVVRAIRAMERQFPVRRPLARSRLVDVTLAIAAVAAAIALGPRLVETIHTGWAQPLP